MMKSTRRFPALRAPRRRSSNRQPLFDALEVRALLYGSGLTIALASHNITGNSGSAVPTGTGTDNAVPLTVNLTSSNPDSITVPATVVIPAGRTTANFSVGAPVGGSAPGYQLDTIRGTAIAELPLATDPSYLSLPLSFQADALAIQGNGKVVVVGTSGYLNTPDYDRMTINRHTADGGLDTTFNQNGLAHDGLRGGGFARATGRLGCPDRPLNLAPERLLDALGREA